MTSPLIFGGVTYVIYPGEEFLSKGALHLVLPQGNNNIVPKIWP